MELYVPLLAVICAATVIALSDNRIEKRKQAKPEKDLVLSAYIKLLGLDWIVRDISKEVSKRARKAQKKEASLLLQHFQIHWKRSEDAFNELTHYQEWLLAKGLPAWKVRVLYHWRKSRTYMQLLKSMALGSAQRLLPSKTDL
ncbi:MAG: hypothetical protein AAFZ17_01405 [Cyanobacteria bacterium J06650_10]